MTQKDIKNLYREFQVPKHIIKHMEAVAKLAGRIADALIAKGIKINKKDLIHAAKIHDILRVCDFKVIPKQNKFWQQLKIKYGKIGHEKALARILKSRGEKSIANLVLKHGFFSVDQLQTWEEKVLYYADKRVEQTKVVSLKERLRQGKKRNISQQDNLLKIKATERKIKALEKELIKILGKTIN